MPLEPSQYPATRPMRWTVGFALLVAASYGAPDELGRPLVRNHTPGEFLSGYECQAIAQDAAGVVYVADGTWIRAYDGVEAHGLPDLPLESAGVGEFAVTDRGVVYAGGPGLVGYIGGTGPDAKFVSLADRLPDTGRDIANIRHVSAVENMVCFSDDKKLLVWRDAGFHVVPCPSTSDSHGARLHAVGPALFVSVLGRPLTRLDGDRLVTVADESVVRENAIVAIASGPRQETLVLLTAERGFFQADAAWHVTPLPIEANRWLAGKRIFRACRLADGSWVVGFSSVSGDGGMRFAPDGSYQGVIDMSVGLVVKTLRSFYPDHEGGLFIGSEMGFSRMEWPSDTTMFDALNGLGTGTVTGIARQQGTLYAMTTEGRLRLVPSDGAGRAAQFQPAPAEPSIAPPSEPGDGTAKPVSRATTSSDRVARAVPRRAAAAVGRVTCIYEESGPKGKVLWVGGEEGLARVDASRPRRPDVPFRAQLRATHVGAGAKLEPEHAPLTFTYFAPRFGYATNVTYQTRLIGQDRTWSPWTAQRERSYPHLPSGDYRFEVRARDGDGVISTPADLAFTVLAPWWLTPWAVAGYVAAGGFIVAGAVQLRTRALRQLAARLEQLVAERTAELAEKNHELTRLHRLESEEKIAARLAEEKARLEVLRYQLNPHFLFNTLASISASLPSGPSAGRTMVERLAEFCRLALHRADDREWTSLGDEVRLLETYLGIEQSRWADMLTVEIDCDPSLARERLPYFLLLPLVENALKYGRATSVDRVGVRLAARRDPARSALVIEVANTGQWIEEGAPRQVSTLGIGLANLRERLSRYYPHANALTLAQQEGWVVATLVLTLEGPPPVV